MDTQNKKVEALAFLNGHTAGVLATATEGNKPHASVVFYVSDDSFSIYFVTRFNTRKYHAIQQNPQVAFTVGTQDTPQTLQIEGTVEELNDRDEKMKILPALIRAMTANENYYAPLTKLDSSELVIMWIKPQWVRWGDYSGAESGTDNVLFEVPLT